MIIVPANRLMWYAVMASAAFTAVGVVVGPWTPAIQGACALLVLGAVIDAVSSRNRLAGVQIELAPVLRLWKDRPGTIPMTVLRGPQTPDEIAIAVALPPTIESEIDLLHARLPVDAERSVVAWPVTPRKRGRFPLTVVAVETDSILRLWRVRRRLQYDNVAIQVYPDLLRDRKSVAGIFLRREGVGVRRMRMVGRGREFERLRDYLPGDAFGDIHWRTTAKRGRPVTKEFQIERMQEVYTVIDASRLSARPLAVPDSGDVEPVIEHFLRAALILGLAAQRQGDLFGVAGFADRVDSFVRANRGTSHFNVCREAIYRTMPRLVSPDFREAFTFLRLRLRRRALLVFLTDLDDPVLAEEFLQHVEVLSKRHVVLVTMVEPESAVSVFHGPPVRSDAEIAEHLAGHVRRRRLRELERELSKKGVGLILLPREHLSLRLVSRYMEIKQRQLL